MRLVDGLADLREHFDVDLFNALHLGGDLPGRLRGEKVVDLAHVVYRILAAGGFQAHGSIGCDHAVGPVAPAYRSIVSHLGGCAGDSDVDRALLDVVGHVHLRVYLSRRELFGVLNNVLHDGTLRVRILFEVGHMLIDHGTGDGQIDDISLAHAHDLDILAYGRDALLEPHQFTLGIEDDVLRLGERRISHAKRCVVGGRDLAAEYVPQIR